MSAKHQVVTEKEILNEAVSLDRPRKVCTQDAPRLSALLPWLGLLNSYVVRRAIEPFDGDSIRSEHRPLICSSERVTDERSSCSHAVNRRGFGSGRKPLSAKKPP